MIRRELIEKILRKLLKSIGNGVHFEPTFRCEFGYNISIGNNFYANFDWFRKCCHKKYSI